MVTDQYLSKIIMLLLYNNIRTKKSQRSTSNGVKLFATRNIYPQWIHSGWFIRWVVVEA